MEIQKKWRPTSFAEIKGAASGVQSNEWWTPPEIFEALHIDFDLDPASAIGGVEWIPTKSYFTKEDDGLQQEWFGRVWLNSPYGKQTGLWLEKFINHGNGIALVFSRTDTKWFHNYCYNIGELRFIKGRLKFVDENGKIKNSAMRPSMLVILTKENIAIHKYRKSL